MNQNYSFLDKVFPVLNKGYIIVNDLMGDDETVVKSARVSYTKSTKKISDSRSLIRYLLRKKHTSPFEQCEISFTIKCPIFVARQWLRHRTANVNEMSLRYSEAPEEFFIPNNLKEQSSVNKQMRNEHSEYSHDVQETIIDIFAKQNNESYSSYKKLIEDYNLSREISRCVLPVTLYTEFVWKIDLHNLLHFISLRADDKHAQYEIVQYAKKIYEIIKEWVPMCCEAFDDYVLGSITFSKQEIKMLKKYFSNIDEQNININMGKNEFNEFLEKINKIKNS